LGYFFFGLLGSLIQLSIFQVKKEFFFLQLTFGALLQPFMWDHLPIWQPSKAIAMIFFSFNCLCSKSFFQSCCSSLK
jgi:hypothetical protein